jgi:hypothetical protein
MNNTVHLSRYAGEVKTRSVEGEGRNARPLRALRPSPSVLTHLDLSRVAGEVY